MTSQQQEHNYEIVQNGDKKTSTDTNANTDTNADKNAASKMVNGDNDCVVRQSVDDPEKSKQTSRKAILHQIYATCAVLIMSASCGIPIGYSAVLLPQLYSRNVMEENSTRDDIIIDIEMGSWIASIHSLATPIGSIISGPLADFLGRRTTLFISIMPIIIGWCVVALAQSYPMLLLGRLLCGFSTGLLAGPAQIYIAETAEPNLRGLLIGAPFVSYSMGILIVYSLGSKFHWRMVAWLGNVLPLMAASSIFFIPESPMWLIRRNQMKRALKSLTFLRANEITAQKELNDLSERFKKEVATAAATHENIFSLCCQPIAYKPLFIVIVFVFLQIVSGTYIVIFYAVDILASFDANVDSKTAATWTAAVRMLCTLLFCIILLFIRRRSILLMAGIGSSLSCLIISILMYTHNTNNNHHNYHYDYSGNAAISTNVIITGICLLAYIAFNTPLMVMPGIMIGELLPAKIRGRTAGGVFTIMNLSLFILTKTFPYIHLSIGMAGVFLMFAGASFAATVFMFMFQPETKGCSLQQIEDYFQGNNWLWFKRDDKYKIVPSDNTTVKA